MSIHEGAKRLARPTTKGVEEFSASVYVDVDTYPVFSTTVRRVCVANYNRRSFLYARR